MGGVLPTHPQRVLGIGGTAGMVHPSTGGWVWEGGGRRRGRTRPLLWLHAALPRPSRTGVASARRPHCMFVQRSPLLTPLHTPPTHHTHTHTHTRCCDWLGTGFMVSRMLGVAPTIADAIVDQLSRPRDKASAAGAAGVPRHASRGWLAGCKGRTHTLPLHTRAHATRPAPTRTPHKPTHPHTHATRATHSHARTRRRALAASE
jgi:hypothetical protein